MNMPIVIDGGAATTKVGIAGMIEPTVEVASAIGTIPNKGPSSVTKEMDYVVENHEGLLKASRTHDFNFMIRNGMVKDWNALEKLWHSCLYEKLRCNPEDHSVVLTESPFSPPENREQAAEIMFEVFNVKGLFFGLQPTLSLVASWGCVDEKLQHLTGTIVDSGEWNTTVVPIADGHILQNCIQQIPLGGRDITTYVQTLLRANRLEVASCQSFEVARQIKEKYGYVGCSGYCGQRDDIVATGNYLSTAPWRCSIGNERYLAGEVLFKPSLLKASPKSRLTPIPQLVDAAVQLSPIDLRRSLYGNIVLASGATILPGFGARLKSELSSIVNSRLDVRHSSTGIEVNVVLDHSQGNSSWLGGSIVGSDVRFEDRMISKKDYEEEGPRIARRFMDTNNDKLW